MANTYTKQIMHVNFSTALRQPLISDRGESELYQYLTGALKNQKAVPIAVGGHRDHVHMLFHYPPTLSLSYIIGEIKKTSSSWGKEHFGSPVFGWQAGYAGFSVDYRGVEPVANYIRNQRAHHQKRSFKEEYRQALRNYGVPYDERYLFDGE